MQPDSSKTDKSSSSTAFNRQLLQTYIALDNWHKFRLRLFVEGIFVGILGGLAISLFRFLLGETEKYRIFLYNTYIIPGFSAGDFKPLLFWLAILAIAGLALYGMGRYAPEAGGSGIPQVKGVILGVMRMRWIRILWVKILAGAVGIGAGLSLGRDRFRSAPSPLRACRACWEGHAWKSATSSRAARAQALPLPSMRLWPV